MVLKPQTPSQSVVIPSFQDLIKSIASPYHLTSGEDFAARSYDTAQSVGSSDRSTSTTGSKAFRCPFTHCDFEDEGFETLNGCSEHLQEHHPRFLPYLAAQNEQAYDLEDEASHTTSPTKAAPVFGTIASVDNTSRQIPAFTYSPKSIGWFDAATSRAIATFIVVKQWTRDEMYRCYWETDERRLLFRDQPDPKKGRPDKSLAAHEDDMTQREQRLQVSKQNHTDKERDRRTRHGEYQGELHTRTPETAHQLADTDPDLAGKNLTSSKGPGKDHQFVSDLYMHNLSAIVVQSEHEGRLVAEHHVQDLKQEVRRLHQLLEAHPVGSAQHVGIDPHYLRGSSPTKRQRRSGAATQEQDSRLPPSPSASPSVGSFKARVFL